MVRAACASRHCSMIRAACSSRHQHVFLRMLRRLCSRTKLNVGHVHAHTHCNWNLALHAIPLCGPCTPLPVCDVPRHPFLCVLGPWAVQGAASARHAFHPGLLRLNHEVRGGHHRALRCVAACFAYMYANAGACPPGFSTAALRPLTLASAKHAGLCYWCMCT